VTAAVAAVAAVSNPAVPRTRAIRIHVERAASVVSRPRASFVWIFHVVDAFTCCFATRQVKRILSASPSNDRTPRASTFAVSRSRVSDSRRVRREVRHGFVSGNPGTRKHMHVERKRVDRAGHTATRTTRTSRAN